MLITIGVILVATIAVAALEIWLFWRLGEREDRRRSQGRSVNRPWTGADNDVAPPQLQRPRQRAWHQRSDPCVWVTVLPAARPHL